MPSVIDINSLIANRDTLQSRYDALTFTISEAEDQQDQLTEQIDTLNNMIAYLQGGAPDITYLANIAGVTAEAIVPVTARISWSAVTHADNYVWVMSLTPDFASTTEVYNGPLLTFDVADLQPGATYYFRGYAIGAGYGNSDTTDTSVLIITQLEDVENFTVTLPGDESFFVGNWDLVTDAQTYNIYKNDANDFGTATQIAVSYNDTFSYTNDGTVGTYYFWIVASAPLFIDSDVVQALAPVVVS